MVPLLKCICLIPSSVPIEPLFEFEEAGRVEPSLICLYYGGYPEYATAAYGVAYKGSCFTSLFVFVIDACASVSFTLLIRIEERLAVLFIILIVPGSELIS